MASPLSPPTPAAQAAPADSGERFAALRRSPLRALSSGGLRGHMPSLLTFVLGCGLSLAAFALWRARQRDAENARFHAQAAPLVANLRSSFDLPLEVLEATTALFTASERVTRAEFGRFVRPALERYPGIRALEWIPVVQAADRERRELEARADGITGFAFREPGSGGAMITAGLRDEYLPVFFMEPGHPLVLGFDCVAEPLRHGTAERARRSGRTAASERLRLFEDPPSVYSVAVFQPVFDPALPRAPGSVLGFTVEVFRVRSLAERALAESASPGIQVTLLDLDAPPDKQLLFASAPESAVEETSLRSTPALRYQTPLRYQTALRFADRNWSIVLDGNGRGGPTSGAPWLALLGGIGMSALAAFGLSARRTIAVLREQIHATQQLGQYTLLERLGQGGMGVVYKARHALLRRPTAIKLLAGADHDRLQLARFEREVQLTSELTHPNTIVVYDFGRTPSGTFYYAMEHIEGLTFEQLVQHDGPQPAARVVHLLRQVASALSEAHGVGLIHRDIKPANLMLCQKGGVPDFVKVMDFGLVKDLAAGVPGGSPPLTLSASTALLGTPSYLAPEAISSPQQVDGRADLYALGAVAYFLLVGEAVFSGETVVEVCGHHLHTPPPRPSERAEVPASLEQLILRCLAKRPAERYASAAELAAALRQLSDMSGWSEAEAAAWWRERGASLLQKRRAATELGQAHTAHG
jgi:serine/threonine-protein kinase